MVWSGQEKSGLVSPLFIRRWKRYFGQWSVWGICVNFRSRLQRIFLNWWRCFRTRRMVAFVNYLEYINALKKSFLNSEIIHVPRMQNSKADSLARTVGKHTSFAIYMDAELPIWSRELVWVCFVDDKKKKQKEKIKK